MWWWVIVALAGLVLLILLVLCIPLDLIFHINTSESPAYQVRLLWLFGLLDKDLRKAQERPQKREKAATVRRKERRHGISPHTVYRVLRTTGLFSQLKRLVLSIYRSFKIKDLAANLKLGLGNPADTALLFAITGPANFLLSFLPYEITIWPTFDGDLAFEAYVHGAARLWPILLLFACLKFIFSLPVMRIARTLVMTQWKRA